MRHAQGSLLSIDVSTREWCTEAIPDARERFVGGRCLGTRLAYERIPFDADPFGPVNRLIFTAGPGELDALGARIVDLERGFNNRRGRDRRDDDALDGIEAAHDAYYERRGWNGDGPDRAT